MDSKLFYHKLDFDLSDTAKKWVIDRYAEKFKTYFYHDADITQVFDEIAQREWVEGPVGQEVLAFLATYGCDSSYQGITTFISNTEDFYPGNPHVDLKIDKDTFNETIIKSRINIMVLGNPEDEMVWWNWLEFGDPRLAVTEYTSINGIKFTCRNVPGDTKPERLEFVGEPTHRARNLLTPSAFVRTDCAHTANISPGPRLLVTVSLDKTIEEILSFNKV
jgi:hypothetical protein